MRKQIMQLELFNAWKYLYLRSNIYILCLQKLRGFFCDPFWVHLTEMSRCSSSCFHLLSHCQQAKVTSSTAIHACLRHHTASTCFTDDGLCFPAFPVHFFHPIILAQADLDYMLCKKYNFSYFQGALEKSNLDFI